MPDSKDIHLPAMNPYKLYDIYLTHHKSITIQVASATFRRILRKEFPSLVFPKWTRFAKCTLCETLRERADKSDFVSEKEMYETALRIHQDGFKKERMELYRLITATADNTTRAEDKRYIFMLDGMDNSKTTLPHRHIKIKAWESKKLLKTHVTGGMSYTGNPLPEVYAWTWHDDFGKGVNVSAAHILRLLQQAPQPLPPILHFQFDNCVSENKNQYLFCFLSWLIEMGTAKEIYVSYLPVGHTHDRVDQYFSRVAMWLRVHNALTLTENNNPNNRCLHEALQQCYSTNPPKVFHLDECADFHSFFTPYSAGLHNFTTKRYFKFAKNKNGKSRFWFKDCITSEKDWKGGETRDGRVDDTEGIDCFIEGKMPRGEPRPQQPHRPTNWSTVVSDIWSIFSELETCDQTWWEAYIEKIEARYRTPVPPRCLFYPLREDIVPWRSTLQRLPDIYIPPVQLQPCSDDEEQAYAGPYRGGRDRVRRQAAVGDLVVASFPTSQSEPFGFSIGKILELHIGKIFLFLDY